LSAEEARAIIDEYPTMEVESYSEHSGTLEEQHFKDEIRRGSCQDSVRIVKTFRERIDEVKSRNKKPPVAFDRILKLATARSLQELSVALDTTPEDVQALFQGALDAAAEEN
ncbi:MAG: CarD family transcriptional regulator, partial [Olsenella sp.]|nr:CarD family transcriptional regulator [Olsenella sp.]